MFNLFRNLKMQKIAESWGVEHVTLDPQGPDKPVRLHLLPSKGRGPSLLYINGQHILPVRTGEAMLLRIFMQELKEIYQPGQEATPEGIKIALKATSDRMHRMYPDLKDYEQRFNQDLAFMQKVIFSVAKGVWPKELEGSKPMTMAQYSSHMTAPFRMDLAIMPTRINNQWACNNDCPGCYASMGAAMDVFGSQMLSLQEWKDVLDILWRAGVPQVSFTGGEPTMHKDLVKMVAHANEFTTRLNTNGRSLTKKLCDQLVAASLDVVQITVYSDNPDTHDKCVGDKTGRAWAQTMHGIDNAIESGLEVSVNIPLVEANVNDLFATIRYLNKTHGVRYFTCSGLLPAGGAQDLIANGESANTEILYKSLVRGLDVALELNVELDFTSPGSLSDEMLQELNLNIPVCGACLGNMAISPSGKVLPCQSWVHSSDGLGDILQTPWKKIWNSRESKRIRREAASKNICTLSEVK